MDLLKDAGCILILLILHAHLYHFQNGLDQGVLAPVKRYGIQGHLSSDLPQLLRVLFQLLGPCILLTNLLRVFQALHRRLIFSNDRPLIGRHLANLLSGESFQGIERVFALRVLPSSVWYRLHFKVVKGLLERCLMVLV